MIALYTVSRILRQKSFPAPRKPQEMATSRGGRQGASAGPTRFRVEGITLFLHFPISEGEFAVPSVESFPFCGLEFNVFAAKTAAPTTNAKTQRGAAAKVRAPQPSESASPAAPMPMAALIAGGYATPLAQWNFQAIPVFASDEHRRGGSNPHSWLTAGFQAKLAIGQVDDPLEAEANQLAERAIRAPRGTGWDSSPSNVAAPALHRKCSQCTPDQKCSRCRQQKAATTAPAHHDPSAQVVPAQVNSGRVRAQPVPAGATAPASVHRALQSAGRPLDPVQRSFFESSLGHDLSDVQIHTDSVAADSAAAVSALAYTVGRHVVFGADRYQPASLDGQRLLAHELVHTIQQGAGQRITKKPNPETAPQNRLAAADAVATISHPAPPVVARDVDPKATAQTVGEVKVFLGGGPGKAVIKFETAQGSRSYILDSLGNLKPGQYTVGVKVHGRRKVEFVFNLSAGQLFHFSYKIEPGQPNPASLFAKEGSVSFVVSMETAPVRQKETEKTNDVTEQPGGTDSLAHRVAAFKRTVKAAGQVRMAENRKALAEWRTFLENKLTPKQVEKTVYAQEVRDLQMTAKKEGGRTLDAYDEAVSTANPLRREKAVGQVRGKYRACTGCHLDVQADNLEKENPGLKNSGLEDWTPINTVLQQNAAAEGQTPTPRPVGLRSTGTEGLDKKSEIHDPSHPGATAASAALAAIQPFLEILGPGHYDVLPADILLQRADPNVLLAAIATHIERRRAAYAKFAEHIAEPDFDYLTLRPIVRELLPLQPDDVQSAIETEIQRAEEWERFKSRVMFGVSLVLLVLAVFPPTSAIGIAGVAAAEGGMGAYMAVTGIESMQEGYWLSKTTGANDVVDPEQQEAAGWMMAAGLLSIVMGGLGLKGAAAKGVKLLRTAGTSAAEAGSRGVIDGLEGEAGGHHFKISEIGSGNPKVKVTSPEGETLYDGPLKDMPQKGFGEAEPATAIKPDKAMYAKQRASALEQKAASAEANAAENEKLAATAQGARKASLQRQADTMRKNAAALRDEANSYLSGAKSPLHDLPTGPEVDAEIDRLAAGQGGRQKMVEIKLTKAELGGKPARLQRGLLSTGRGRVVLRVEGGGSQSALGVSAAGGVKIAPRMLYLNFGSVERALEFLAKRGPGARIVAFEVDEAWAQSLRSGAVPQEGASLVNPKTPKLVDPSDAADQLQIPPDMIPEMEKFIVPGSGKVILTK